MYHSHPYCPRNPRLTFLEEVDESHTTKKGTRNEFLFVWSGRRGSNPRPSAWKANALSTELLPQLYSGQRWIRTTEGVSQQIYSLPHLAILVFAQEQSRKRVEGILLPQLRCKGTTYFFNLQEKSIIFIAVTAHSSPLLPKVPPQRSSACCILLVVISP